MLSFDVVFFFFKQKTAYEMRISDWSSDVCSSDLDFVITHDGTPIYVRVSPGMPMVEILTRLAHDVRSRRQAALEVSVLNRTHPMVKFLLHDRSVLLVLSIPAMPFAHHHLAALLPDFISTRDEVIDALVDRKRTRPN